MQSAPPALAKRTVPVLSKPVAFTSTKVPKFSGGTSWDQYCQVFDAIVRSNGSDDATVTLQLLSHLEGDALNVALLMPEVNRAMRAGLVGALTEHYGSADRLADYRHQFTQLRLIRDRFVAGHENCALRRILDNVPPETPIRDIVDRCRVWESHTDPGVRRIVKPMPERALPVYTMDERRLTGWWRLLLLHRWI